MEKLPPEIKEHVTSFLRHPTDLTRMALTSSSYLSAARRHLYRKVVLRSDLPNLQHTFALLQRSPKLRSAVRSIELETDEMWDKGSPVQRWFDGSIFSGMDHLRSIKFNRLPCVPAKSFQAIFSAIYMHCPNLEDIVAINILWPASVSTPNWVLDCDLDVPLTLRSVIFESSFSSEMRMFMPLTILKPYSLIESLEFSMYHNPEMLEDICTYTFEHLKSLRIHDFAVHTSRELIGFLLANPSINVLYFPRARSIDVTGMKVSILPSLRSISALPGFIQNLAKICDSVKLVEVMNLNLSTCRVPISSVSELVASTGPFPNLKHLSISNSFSPTIAISVMNLFHESPVEWWTGGFYSRANEKDLKRLFSAMSNSLPTVKRVDICEWTSPPPLSENQQEILRSLAVRMRLLEKVSLFHNHLELDEISAIFRVERMHSGKQRANLIRTYQLVEGGPYLDDRRCVEYNSLEWESDPVLE